LVTRAFGREASSAWSGIVTRDARGVKHAKHDKALASVVVLEDMGRVHDLYDDSAQLRATGHRAS